MLSSKNKLLLWIYYVWDIMQDSGPCKSNMAVSYNKRKTIAYNVTYWYASARNCYANDIWVACSFLMNSLSPLLQGQVLVIFTRIFFLRWFLKITFSDKHFLRAGQQQQQSSSNSLLRSLNVEKKKGNKINFIKCFINKKNIREEKMWSGTLWIRRTAQSPSLNLL